MAQRLQGVVLVAADDHVGDRLLVVLRDGLGYSPDLGSDEEGELEGHRIVGDFHLRVTDGELHLGGDQFGVLVDGDLVDWRVVLFLLLLSLLLFLLGRHHPALSIYYEVALITKH